MSSPMGGSSKAKPVCLRPARTPGVYFPLPGLIIFILFLLSNIWGAYLIGTTDALKELMKTLGVGQSLAEDERSVLLTKLTNWAFSVNLINFLPMGLLCDAYGPKVVGVLGCLCNAVGMVLMVFGNSSIAAQWFAATFLGMSCAGILNAHVSVSALFPGYNLTIVGLLGAASNLSCFIPIILRQIALALGTASVGYIYPGGCLLFAAIDFLVLPHCQFDIPSDDADEKNTSEGVDERTSLLLPADEKSRTCTSQVMRPIRASRASRLSYHLPSVDAVPPICPEEEKGDVELYAHLTQAQQLFSPNLWIFGIWFSLHVFRRNYFAQTTRAIFIEVAAAGGLSQSQADIVGGNLTDQANLVQPLAFIFSPICGLLADKLGLFPVIFLLNTVTMVMYAAILSRILWMQWVSIWCYNIVSSYLFMHMCAFVQTYFGLKFFGMLVGVLNLFGVIGTFSFEPYVQFVVTNMFGGSHVAAASVIVALSALLYFFPSILWFNIRKDQKIKDQKKHLSSSSV